MGRNDKSSNTLHKKSLSTKVDIYNFNFFILPKKDHVK